ncbi:hypothetical protein EVAR_32049_1 [Eumeta japonica]|uniref:Uncharacterized protein n=1 Tax=Eumeta variegata TaxID=151549 RepID=A0A4C1WN95_EUMVA|nr:hypothetical protein EVAR_32049_1 [Eumeta japonica]
MEIKWKSFRGRSPEKLTPKTAAASRSRIRPQSGFDSRTTSFSIKAIGLRMQIAHAHRGSSIVTDRLLSARCGHPRRPGGRDVAACLCKSVLLRARGCGWRMRPAIDRPSTTRSRDALSRTPSRDSDYACR